jgi:cardiolipin synthase
MVGSALYYVLGINRIRRSAVSIMGRDQVSGPVEALEPTAVSHLSEAGLLPDAGKRQLAQEGNQEAGLPLLKGNEIKPLINGDAAFPEMLAAIAAAKRSIMLSSYIFDRDAAGREFVEALAQAQNRGVQVRVLVDATGSRYSFPSIISSLRKAGITAARFMPNLQPTRIAAINLRSHRKILVIDGEVGFTGGLNIRQGNYLKRNFPSPIQDLHFRIRGPVVAHLRQVFIEDWMFTTREKLDGEVWSTPLEGEYGEVLARGVPDGPDRDFEKTLWTVLGAIAAARQRILILTPYFLPDATMTRFLSVAAMSGVQVDIILPEQNNIKLVQWASMACLPALLQKGCRVYLTPPPFDHSKMMLIDDAWTLIGSANWDARSLRLNFEFNIECYSREFASEMHAIFAAKLAKARPLTVDDLAARSASVKLRDGVMRLMAPYL